MGPFWFKYSISISHYKLIIVWDPDRIDLGAIINLNLMKKCNKKCRKSHVLLSVTIDTIGQNQLLSLSLLV